MASVNYTSRCHQDAMALFWTVSYVMNSAEGTDGKQYHDYPLVNKEGKRKNTDNLYQSSDFNSEACKTQPSHLPWDHLHLNASSPHRQSHILVYGEKGRLNAIWCWHLAQPQICTYHYTPKKCFSLLRKMHFSKNGEKFILLLKRAIGPLVFFKCIFRSNEIVSLPTVYNTNKWMDSHHM